MKKILIVSVVPIFLLGIYLGAKIPQKSNEVNKSCDKNYSYINKSLGCNQNFTISKALYTKLKDSVNDYITKKVEGNSAAIVSVYFRDLNSGPTFGINEESSFIPASLLKVPLLMTFLNLEDDQPDLMQREIVYKKFITDVSQNLTEVDDLTEGKAYKVEDLLKRMIVYSDNASYDTLRAYLEVKYPNDDFFVKTLTNLGLIYPMTSSENAFSTKSYASIFRQLYNASYLSIDQSEKALGLLTQSSFKEGLAAGVPKKIKVAHKFGRRTNLPNNGIQLHDCGIIYYPNNPYLLCIMTRGSDEKKLEEIINKISADVYKEIGTREL